MGRTTESEKNVGLREKFPYFDVSGEARPSQTWKRELGLEPWVIDAEKYVERKKKKKKKKKSSA